MFIDVSVRLNPDPFRLSYGIFFAFYLLILPYKWRKLIIE